MANPVSSIVNPLSKKETLLFTVPGVKRQLGMAIYPLDKTGTIHPYQDNGVPTGYVATPGALAAVIRRGLVTVYGFTNQGVVPEPEKPAGETPTPAPAKTNTLSQLMPYPNPLSKDEDLNTSYTGLAAVSDEQDISYVYFAKQVSAGQHPTLREAILQQGSEPETKTTGAVVIPTSRLAALYFPIPDADEGERMIFFQHDSGSGKPIQCIKINAKGKTDPATLPGTTVAAEGTPLAATYVDNADGTRIIYLYFVNTNQDLYQTYKKGAEDWTTPAIVPDVTRVLLGSQITATHDKKHNHVFYIEGENPKKGYLNHRVPLV
ncbi:hypothetical protein B0H66DRAFT_629117 [Apodospora peruviana]|uniref:Fucose-specific lectin n=1 Tax=Apodospora peruviana TaxID=516989 RepID=A0AAE0HWQ7_9PEZI|nr:hypothetical protein B0H66DRAFT_629117 [Apodospora peruviana]